MYTKKQFNAKIKQYENEVKEQGFERPLTQDEINNVEEDLSNLPDQYRESFQKAQNGDYSDFQNLPLFLRNYIGAREMKKFEEVCGAVPALKDERVQTYLKENAMNAGFRAGLSAKKQGNLRIDQLDSFMSEHVLGKTLMIPTEDETNALKTEVGEDQLQRKLDENLARQRVMAKTLMLAQLGKYDLKNDEGDPMYMDATISETVVHGGRTNFILPYGEGQDEMMEAFTGQNPAETSGLAPRTATSHFVNRREVMENGMLKKESKEIATRNPFKVFSNQYGMNIAVGGIGATGPDQKPIVGNGEMGHMYFRMEKGDETHCGSLLIGIEGSEPGKTSALGQKHDFRAKSAKQSAFFTDKLTVGSKTDGRTVDLSGLSANDLREILLAFDEKYSALQTNATSSQAREELDRFNKLLTGKHMTGEDLRGFLTDLELDQELVDRAVANKESGYLAKAELNEKSVEDMKNFYRGRMSQEKACALAEQRFASGDSLIQYVSAIKELAETHKTRSLGWKLLHPIKNFLEYRKIKNLTERLTEEKGFVQTMVESAFQRCEGEVDSFAVNFGHGLNNDQTVLDAIDTYKRSRLINLGYEMEKDREVEQEPPIQSEVILDVNEALDRGLDFDLDSSRSSISMEEVSEEGMNKDVKRQPPYASNDEKSHNKTKEFV